MTPFDLPTRSYQPAPDEDAGAVVSRLAAALGKRRSAGLEPVARRAQISTRTVLDSADRRLRAAGWDLALESGPAGRGRLVLRDGTGSPATTADLSRVRRRFLLPDLPPGPLRDRVAPVLEMRALLPIASVRRRVVPVDVRNDDGKTVARLAVSDLWALPPSPKPPVRLTGRVQLDAILGYPKAFTRVDQVLRDRLSLSDAEHDVVDEAVEALGGDPAGLVTAPKIDLDRDEPAEDATRRILAWLADVVDANLPGTIDDLDSEFLHDLRVAVRRSRSVLREMKGVFVPETRRDHADALRWIQSVTGLTRDLDVQLLEWDELVARVPQERRADLAPVHAVLTARRAAAFRALRRNLRGREFRRDWAAWRAYIDEKSAFGPLEDRPDAARPVSEVAARRIRKVYERMLRDGGKIDADSPAQDLHDLRKKGKELRYLLELFGSLWPTKQVKPLVSSLKGLQDVLGRHQDREVQAAMLRALAPELAGTEGGAAALLALGAVIDRVEQDQHEARGKFAARFERFEGWRLPT